MSWMIVLLNRNELLWWRKFARNWWTARKESTEKLCRPLPWVMLSCSTLQRECAKRPSLLLGRANLWRLRKKASSCSKRSRWSWLTRQESPFWTRLWTNSGTQTRTPTSSASFCSNFSHTPKPTTSRSRLVRFCLKDCRHWDRILGVWW